MGGFDGGLPLGLHIGKRFFAQVPTVAPAFGKLVQLARLGFPVGIALMGFGPSRHFGQQGQTPFAVRRAMIEEAKALGEAPQLRIDAVKALQQRWQLESQAVPVERKLAQKLWDAFRQPLDEAFSRKTQSRAAAPAQNLSEHDKAVMAAAEELEKAIAQGDAAQIRQAMAHVNAVSAGQAAAPAATPPAPVATPPEEDASPPSSDAPEGEPTVQPDEAVAPAPKVVVVKKVVAVRGDDRPGQKKTEPAAAGRFGDKSGPRRP